MLTAEVTHQAGQHEHRTEQDPEHAQENPDARARPS